MHRNTERETHNMERKEAKETDEILNDDEHHHHQQQQQQSYKRQMHGIARDTLYLLITHHHHLHLTRGPSLSLTLAMYFPFLLPFLCTHTRTHYIVCRVH